MSQFKSGTEHIRYKHGMSHSRLHNIWSNMKTRCFTKSYYLYELYGGRGITVCEEWKNDFLSFYTWSMSHGYSENLTLDRIDNNGNYSPENCRWTTMKEQASNRRSNHLLTLNGETKTISEWSKVVGIERRTIQRRLKLGWTVEKALTTPVGKKVIE